MDIPPRILNLWTAFRRRTILHTMGIVALFFVLDVGSYVMWPPVGGLALENPKSTSFMEYRKDQWEARQEELGKPTGKGMPIQWKWVPLSRISPNLRKAVVLSEDDTFWDHEGFNFDMLRQAVERNWKDGAFSMGGSTITQQLAKNLWFTPKRSLLRKLKEAIMTVRLESSLEKKRILELYLNTAEWGEGIYGAEAAARRYFGKSAASLSPREAASLAAMLPAPLIRSPASPVVRRLSARLAKRMER